MTFYSILGTKYVLWIVCRLADTPHPPAGTSEVYDI